MSIQSEISRLNGAKSSIEGSLTEMGVEVPSGAKMETLASLLENEVVGHIQNFDNPHQVTASQIGAATSSDIENYVVANPTLAGTESNLSAIQIGNIAYAIPSSGGIVAEGTLVLKGEISSNSELPSTYSKGWIYRITASGIYAGKVCEVNDNIICKANSSISSFAYTDTSTNGVDFTGQPLPLRPSGDLSAEAAFDLSLKLGSNSSYIYGALSRNTTSRDIFCFIHNRSFVFVSEFNDASFNLYWEPLNGGSADVLGWQPISTFDSTTSLYYSYISLQGYPITSALCPEFSTISAGFSAVRDWIDNSGGGSSDEDWYVSQGNIVANPSLIGTENNLESIQIGETIYKISSSGGSGGISALTSETPTDLNGILIGTESHLDIIALDIIPIENSPNPVMSSGVYDELELRTKSSTLTSAEYAALKSAGTLDSNTIYFITDDYIPIEEEINEAIESALATIPSLIDEAVASSMETVWIAIDSKSEVTANPTIVGTESSLFSIQIDDVNYTIPSGGGGSSEIPEGTLVLKGDISSANELPATHSKGWVYRITSPGTYAGKICDVNDTIICKANSLISSFAYTDTSTNGVDFSDQPIPYSGPSTSSIVSNGLYVGVEPSSNSNRYYISPTSSSNEDSYCFCYPYSSGYYIVAASPSSDIAFTIVKTWDNNPGYYDSQNKTSKVFDSSSNLNYITIGTYLSLEPVVPIFSSLSDGLSAVRNWIDNPGGGSSDNDWYVIQSNIDNPVSGPSTSTSGHIPVFSNSRGNILDDGYGIASAISSDSSSIPRTDAVNDAINSAIGTAEFSNNKVIALSSAVTDDQYPSALSVWTLFNSITNANEVSY